jgi:hypothetical protein
MYGEDFNLEDDSEILKINSPRDSVGGPYAVVYKDLDERWAIVAFDWNRKPRLGIRWFWGNGGNPFSSANPIWLVVPPSLTDSILNGLPLNYQWRKKLEEFLAGNIPGTNIPKKEEF